VGIGGKFTFAERLQYVEHDIRTPTFTLSITEPSVEYFIDKDICLNRRPESIQELIEPGLTPG